MTTTQVSMYEHYDSLFESVIADTPALKDECYRIRYQVYCHEYEGYEDPANFPDSMERDAYDAHSVHALLRFRPTGHFIGTTRLILNPTASSNNLPVDKLCAENAITLPKLFSHQHIAEVSRFCISKELRQRALDALNASPLATDELKHAAANTLPSVAFLVRCVLQLSWHYKVYQWCAEMEPFLLRLLMKLGIHFDHAGLVDFHGKRQICHKPIDALLARVKQEQFDVWEVITKRGEYCHDVTPSPLKAAV